jgi:Fur family transcriptional regulator, zinc uptake regulator
MSEESAVLPKPKSNPGRILEALRGANRPLTAYQVLDRVKTCGISAPVSVYRALRSLAQNGFVHRIETLNAYTICTHPNHDGPAVFEICEQCGTVREICSQGIQSWIDELAGPTGFTVRASNIELLGNCIECRETPAQSMETCI